MPEDIKPVLDAIVKVFDGLNRMNRGEIFETLEILKSDSDITQKIAMLDDKKLSFKKILEDIQNDLSVELQPLFQASLNIQMASILYNEEDKNEAILRWEENLFSKGMNIHRLTSAEFEKLNPSSETRVDDRFKDTSAATRAISKDLERMWMGMTSRHVCVLVDGKQLYRLNSMANIFEPTFVPIEASKENIEALAERIPNPNQSMTLDALQIKTRIGHKAFSKAFTSERFEWEYKKKESSFFYELLFGFNNNIKSAIKPLDVLGVICDDMLLYLGDLSSNRNKLYNLAAFTLTIALLSLATTALVGMLLSNPVGWATLGLIITGSWILTATAVLSRSINLLGWYLTHEPADNPNSEAFLSSESRFRLTPEEEQVYVDKGYTKEQIGLVKEALVALAIEMKLFSGAGQKRHNSLFTDKIHQGTLIQALKSCDLKKHDYQVKTESRWKHGGIDREFDIGAPVNPPKLDSETSLDKPAST